LENLNTTLMMTLGGEKGASRAKKGFTKYTGGGEGRNSGEALGGGGRMGGEGRVMRWYKIKAYTGVEFRGGSTSTWPTSDRQVFWEGFLRRKKEGRKPLEGSRVEFCLQREPNSPAWTERGIKGSHRLFLGEAGRRTRHFIES